jgi:hypothetical protein
MRKRTIVLWIVSVAVAVGCDRKPEPTSVAPTAERQEKAAPVDGVEAEEAPTSEETQAPEEIVVAEESPDAAKAAASTETPSLANVGEDVPIVPLDAPAPTFGASVKGTDRIVLARRQVILSPTGDNPEPNSVTLTGGSDISEILDAIGPEQGTGERLPRMRCPANHEIEFFRGDESLAFFTFWCGPGAAVGSLYGKFDVSVKKPKTLGRLVNAHLGTSADGKARTKRRE